MKNNFLYGFWMFYIINWDVMIKLNKSRVWLHYHSVMSFQLNDLHSRHLLVDYIFHQHHHIIEANLKIILLLVFNFKYNNTKVCSLNKPNTAIQILGNII